ncbi:hypothetical protein [Providencia sp.]|uniref:hypothetical protein n=1 Tax=Providencia sp. TaxID=589 RepID=UPI003F9571AE
MILKLLLLLLISISQLSWASYINSCNLDIDILENASAQISCLEIEENICNDEAISILVSGKIINARPSGRADKGCRQYIGQNYRQSLSIDDPKLNLKRGDVAVLNETFEEDNRNPISRYTLFVGIKK